MQLVVASMVLPSLSAHNVHLVMLFSVKVPLEACDIVHFIIYKSQYTLFDRSGHSQVYNVNKVRLSFYR